MTAAFAACLLLAQPGPQAPDAGRVAESAVEQTNAFRKAESLPAVAPNERLTEAASGFADYLARHDRFSHTADGRTPAERAKAAGYDYCLVLENIAYQLNSAGFETADLAGRFVAGWKESPGHRKNMLDPDATETGVAVARSGGSGRYYAVQLFGRPKSQAVRVEVANTSGAAVEYRLGGETFAIDDGVTRTHTLCRPAELALAAGGDPVKTADGDRYAVVKAGDGVALKKQ